MKTQRNTLTHGRKTSTSTKIIEFDTNDGASNPKLQVANADKALHMTSNTVKAGDGTAGNKFFTFDIGSGSNNPEFRWNNSTSKIEFSNDGTTYTEIGASTAATRVATAKLTGYSRTYSSTSFSDGTINTNGTFTVVQNIGSIGTIAQLLDGSLDQLPGITFTPAVVGTYKIRAAINGYGAGSNTGYAAQLLDGATQRDYETRQIIHAGGDPSSLDLECIADFASLTGRDFKAQLKMGGGGPTFIIIDIFGSDPVIFWTVEKIN